VNSHGSRGPAPAAPVLLGLLSADQGWERSPSADPCWRPGSDHADCASSVAPSSCAVCSRNARDPFTGGRSQHGWVSKPSSTTMRCSWPPHARQRRPEWVGHMVGRHGAGQAGCRRRWAHLVVPVPVAALAQQRGGLLPTAPARGAPAPVGRGPGRLRLCAAAHRSRGDVRRRRGRSTTGPASSRPGSATRP
jgi:hypothetical protein